MGLERQTDSTPKSTDRVATPENKSRGGRILMVAEDLGTHGVRTTFNAYKYWIEHANEFGYISHPVDIINAKEDVDGWRKISLPFYEGFTFTIPSPKDMLKLLTNLLEDEPEALIVAPEGPTTMIVAAMYKTLQQYNLIDPKNPLIGMYTTSLIRYAETYEDPGTPVVNWLEEIIKKAFENAGVSTDDVSSSSHNVLSQTYAAVKKQLISYLNAHKVDIVKGAERALFGFTDVAVVQSQKALGEVRDEIGLTPFDIRIHPRGVDYALFRSEGPRPGEKWKDPYDGIRESYKKSHRGEEPIIVLSLGRISPEKNWREIIEAARVFNLRGDTKYIFTFVGKFSSAQERKEFDSLIEKYQLKDMVFYMGEANHTDTPGYYQHADIFVSASKEPWGHVPREAGVAGTKVVAVANDPSSEWIEEGVTGITYEQIPGKAELSAQRLTQAIFRASSMHTDKKTFEESVNRNIYSWPEVVKMMLDLIAEKRGKTSTLSRALRRSARLGFSSVLKGLTDIIEDFESY